MAIKTAQRIQPRAAEIDATGEFPKDLLETLGKQGLFSILIPEEYGGNGGDLTSFCLVVEEIAKVCGSSSLMILAQGIGSMPILLGGNASQKERYLTQIAEKNSLAAFALNEPDCGLEASSLKTKAEKQGTSYLLNGQKSFVTHGGIAQFYSVFAMTHPDQGHRGLSAFVVEEGTPGLRFGKREEKIGLKGIVMTDVIFEDCRVPEENRLGRGRRGLADRHKDTQPVEAGHRGSRRRHCPGGPRFRDPLCQGTDAVRKTPHLLSGDPVHDRGYGHSDRGGTGPCLPDGCPYR